MQRTRKIWMLMKGLMRQNDAMSLRFCNFSSSDRRRLWAVETHPYPAQVGAIRYGSQTKGV